MDWITIGTLVTALITAITAILMYATVKEMKKSSMLVSFQGLMPYLGSFENIGKIREWVRTLYKYRDGELSLDAHKILSTRGRRDLLALSASLDRAAFLVLSSLSKYEAKHFENLFGDVYIDLWAVCYLVIDEDQGIRKDFESRMYFEFLAYRCLQNFQKIGRECRTMNLYQTQPKLKIRMEGRFSLLQERLQD